LFRLLAAGPFVTSKLKFSAVDSQSFVESLTGQYSQGSSLIHTP
jgi:hypothetical protein